MPSTLSSNLLLAHCDRAYPPTGLWGYATLLSGTLASGLVFTASASTNQLTTASAHGLVTGSRFRVAGGTLPSPLVANTDYYAIVSSSTVLSLATSLANAQANTSIDLSDAGSGVLTLTEQALTAADPLSVLINKEISHPSFASRLAITDLGAATIVSGAARKPDKILSINNTSLSQSLSYRYILFIESSLTATGTLGNVPSASPGWVLEDRGTVDTIAPGDPPRAIFFPPLIRNA